MNTRIRSDMQRINDLYNTERRDHLEAKQQIINLESEVDKFRLEFGSLQSDALQAAELKHQNQHLVAQLNHGDRQMMDVKSAVEAMESRFKMKIEAQDEEFKRQNDQYLSTLQDRDNLRKEIERESLKNRTLEEKLTSLNLEKTKLGSIVEELLAKESADMHSSQMVADSLDKAKMKISELGQALGEKERKIISMSRQATDVENDHEKEKLGFAAKIAELSALVTQLQHEKNLIEKESQVNESKVGSIQVEMSRLSNEVQMAKDHSEAILKQKGEKELKLIEDRVGIAAQLDEVRALFMTAQSENEVLQGLLKDLKEKQYTEKQRQKELEALLVSETDALQHEIQDANESLRRVETEKAKLEEHIKGEAMSATKVSQTLRMELEKRVEELTTIRKERDLLQAERGKFLDEIAGLEARLQRDEATFKKTLENERNMTQGEVRTKINKLRSLEAEKADLLTELNSYMSQINDLKHSLAKAQQDVVEQRRIAGDCNSEADTATIKVMSLESQLLVSKRREEEVEEKCSKIDKEMKAQIMKHAQEMNEAIRPLNDQIKELEDQLRKAGDAADEQEVRYNRLKISEQKFAKEAEKARIDKEFSVNAYNEMEEKLSNEIGLLRVELRDQKLMNENGNQIQNRQEAMISELRLELSKSQNETKRERDDRITVEEKLEIAMRRLEQTQMDLDEANNTSKRHQTRLYEMEEDASKKEKALEKYRKDLEILEAESIAEVRRISLILSANEREIVDSRSVIANLQRELTESKSGMGMMKQSTNHTVHNLLDELRNTEDALSAARRKHHVEVEENHLKLSELQSNLDSVQSSLDVAESKLRADKTNNELRISQLETEVERLRKHSDGKDERIQELEKAKQTDRQRHLQMRDALTGN
jgi:chromosome segregation ATPase